MLQAKNPHVWDLEEERITVKQAILSLVCQSANDSAVVLAESLGGQKNLSLYV